MTAVIQLTDIHVQDFGDLRVRDFATKRALGFVNYRYRRAHEHQPAILRDAVARACAAQPDLVVISGDLSNLGLPSELRAARDVLAPIAEAGIPVRVVPGNHDYYIRSAAGGAFEDIFADWLAADAREDQTYPYVVRVGEMSCLMLSSAIPTAPMMAYGRLGRAQLNTAERLALAERDDGRPVLMVVHHHPVRALHKRFDRPRDLRDGKALCELAVRVGASLIVHGHNHFFDLRPIAPGGPFVLGLSSSSTARADRSERRGQIGRYTFDAERLVSVEVADWDGHRFADWREVSLPR